MKLFLTNSLTRKKEEFIPLKDNKIGMYVCGITPYADSHIGHGRCYTNFDVLYRLLKLLDFDVTYVRNLTDIDDKLLNKAETEEKDILAYKKLADKYIESYWQDMQSLNNLKPDFEPRVTETIPEIIKYISELIEKKHAYILDGDVYFDVLSFSNYGKLSGKNLKDLRMGSRIKIDKRKKHPADFVLWKGNKENLFWESPWGYGRPGWHIECSTMSQKFLGDTVDIHGGGMDLIFPHHENEVAQSECHNSKHFVKYWLHNAFININKEKMSKSVGNFFTLKMIFEQFDPMVLRFYFLQHQYRTPIDFTLEGLNAAKSAYKKLVRMFEGVDVYKDYSLENFQNNDITKDMLLALLDDLNTPKLLGILFENIEKIKADEKLARLVKTFLTNVFGITLKPLEDKIELTPQIKKFIQKRKIARQEKNWTLADQIRDKLKSIGYEVQDKKYK